MTQTAQCTASRTVLPAPLAAQQSEAEKFIKTGDIPEGLECPIALAPMHDPVSLDGHGQVFDRLSLQKHFGKGPPYKNPASNESIVGLPHCTPRLDLRAKYDQFRADVLALDSSKGAELPTGTRRPAGPLVTGHAADG